MERDGQRAVRFAEDVKKVGQHRADTTSGRAYIRCQPALSVQDDGVLYTLSDCPVWLPSSFELPTDAADFIRICPRTKLEHCDSHYVSLVLPMNEQQMLALLRVLTGSLLVTEELWYLVKPSRRTCQEIVRDSRIEGDPTTLVETSSLVMVCSVGEDFQMSADARLNLVYFVRTMAERVLRQLNMYLLERDAPIVEEVYMFVDGGREESRWLLM
jgi:hypothetical protein